MRHVVTDRYPYYNYWIATGSAGVALTAISASGTLPAYQP